MAVPSLCRMNLTRAMATSHLTNQLNTHGSPNNLEFANTMRKCVSLGEHTIWKAQTLAIPYYASALTNQSKHECSWSKGVANVVLIATSMENAVSEAIFRRNPEDWHGTASAACPNRSCSNGASKPVFLQIVWLLDTDLGFWDLGSQSFTLLDHTSGSESFMLLDLNLSHFRV